MKKQNTGITLIALVITIIVLLILAGVTIATLTGENGILTQATNAKEKNNSARAEEEVALALSNLKIEESIKDMTQSEKTAFLKKELESFKSGESVEVNLSKNGGSINHRGLGFEVDENYVLKQNATLNKSDWDRKAAPTDCFIWLSDNQNSPDYGTVIGYTSKVSSYTTLRYPTRCKKVELTYDWDRYNSAGVSSDGPRSFMRNIREVELPETVTSIGSYAFKSEDSDYFGSLEKINIPDSVTSIGDGAFRGCSRLSGSIRIPNNVTRIGENTFYNCTSLTSIEISDSVSSIDNYAFAGCNNLESINVSSGNQYYSSVNGILYNKEQTTIILLPPNIDESMIPEGLEILQCNHPHDNNMSTYYTKTIEGATQLNLTFSSQCYLEDSCDYVEVYDGNDNLIYSSRHNGSLALANKNLTVSGDTVKIKLITDYSVTYWGFLCVIQGN